MKLVYEARGFRQEYDLSLEHGRRILRDQEWVRQQFQRRGIDVEPSWTRCGF